MNITGNACVCVDVWYNVMYQCVSITKLQKDIRDILAIHIKLQEAAVKQTSNLKSKFRQASY